MPYSSPSGNPLAKCLHGADTAQRRWLQADIFDQGTLEAARLVPGSLAGVLEPGHRGAAAGPGGPPHGSDPNQLADQFLQAGFLPAVWEPAQGSIEERENEWLGL